MIEKLNGKSFAGTPAENYQRFFVPAIGAPIAEDLIGMAGLRRGERVLDVACGTGVVTRLAAERVGAEGAVAGLDVNPGMIAVARAQASAGASPGVAPGVPVEWHAASADAMPLPDNAFDVVLCQMGLQFFPDKPGALREMRRVLEGGGRVFAVVPGPKPPVFAILTDALARHLGPKAAAFGDLVFSLHAVDELSGLMQSAGFRQVDVQAKSKALVVPAPADFLWQYLYSTPLAEAAEQAGAARRDALERDVCLQWQSFVADGSMRLEVGVTTASGLK